MPEDNNVQSVSPQPKPGVTSEPRVTDTKAGLPVPSPLKPIGKFSRLKHKYLSHKKLSITLTVAAVLLIALGVPQSRYLLLGTFLKKDFNVLITDDTTKKPVSSATVMIAGKSATTDKDGKATIRVKVGRSTLSVVKKYYTTITLSVTVEVTKQKSAKEVGMTATGRQVPITVFNKITGKPVENVTIKAADTEAKTDKDGTVSVVLPADKTRLTATFEGKGYNSITYSIEVTDQKVPENTFKIVPSGKLYFLSKLSGNIDVVKTDLDGGNRETILTGTGKEDDANTILLASRDWKYLALQSRRDSVRPKLYLIDTSSDKLTTIDEGNVAFTITGWTGHYFVYWLARIDVEIWQPKEYALKSYAAETGKLILLDESSAEGANQSNYASEFFGSVYALKSAIVYVKNWQANYYANSLLVTKQATISTIQPDGSSKSVLKSSGVSADSTYSYISFDALPYESNGIYYKYNLDDSIYKYEAGKINATTEITKDNFYKTYPTYLLSPDGSSTFWSESRDGKNVLFVGNDSGGDGKQIATLSELSPYGWYSNEYLLVSKGGSELFIMPVGGGTPLKISDYHKPAQSFNGYGGGYGG
jgi:hypothetical protein